MSLFAHVPDDAPRIQKTMTLTPEAIRALKVRLKKTVVTILFQKRDGTKRYLRGTLMPSWLPEKDPKIVLAPRKTPKGVLPVWDTINGGFRSFRYDSVLTIE